MGEKKNLNNKSAYHSFQDNTSLKIDQKNLIERYKVFNLLPSQVEEFEPTKNANGISKTKRVESKTSAVTKADKANILKPDTSQMIPFKVKYSHGFTASFDTIDFKLLLKMLTGMYFLSLLWSGTTTSMAACLEESLQCRQLQQNFAADCRPRDVFRVRLSTTSRLIEMLQQARPRNPSLPPEGISSSKVSKTKERHESGSINPLQSNLRL